MTDVLNLRLFVILKWLAVLVILFAHGIPKSVALVAFTSFRVTAVCATLWLLFRTAQAFGGRFGAKIPLLDAMLILPMFGFWFLARTASF